MALGRIAYAYQKMRWRQPSASHPTPRAPPDGRSSAAIHLEARENVSRFEKVKEFTNPPSLPPPLPSLPYPYVLLLLSKGLIFLEQFFKKRGGHTLFEFSFWRGTFWSNNISEKKIGGTESAAKAGLFTALVKMCRHQNQKLKQRKNFVKRSKKKCR